MTFRTLHAFADPALLEQAITHPSFANEHPGTPTNQRMEFLGDAVLQLVVSEMLLERFPDWDEGKLTKARSRLVDRRQCTLLAEQLGMAGALRTERGLAGGVASGGSKVLADAFEALVAAIYADAGLPAVRTVLGPLFAPSVDTLADGPLKDVKSRLQEWCQARRLPLPAYSDPLPTGPAHARRFHVAVTVGETTYGPAEGTSKKAAEVAAATLALGALAAE